jgi:hypothetical protein
MNFFLEIQVNKAEEYLDYLKVEEKVGIKISNMD